MVGRDTRDGNLEDANWRDVTDELTEPAVLNSDAQIRARRANYAASRRFRTGQSTRCYDDQPNVFHTREYMLDGAPW